MLLRLNRLALVCLGLSGLTPSLAIADIYLGQGTMSGEVTTTTALVQTRLTATTELNDDGDMPGAKGVVAFRWSDSPHLENAQQTALIPASPHHDYIARAELSGLCLLYTSPSPRDRG